MLTPHFYKAYCKLGIYNLPHGQTEPADGVEKAPDFIITQDFLKQFKDAKVSSFYFALPQVLDTKDHYKVIISDSLNFKNLLDERRHKDLTQVVIGGDHCITFASTLSDIDNFGTDIGFIHFDSHGDFNLYKESPSRNFHGMYIRALFDNFDLKKINALVPEKMPTENFLFIGDLELDQGEKKFFTQHELMNINHQDMEKQKDKSLRIVKDFVAKFKHIHISFDVDVFKKSLAPATGTPSKDGFEKEPIFEIINILKSAKSLTLDIAEVNPQKEGAEKTIALAQEVLSYILLVPSRNHA